MIERLCVVASNLPMNVNYDTWLAILTLHFADDRDIMCVGIAVISRLLGTQINQTRRRFCSICVLVKIDPVSRHDTNRKYKGLIHSD